MGIRAVVGATVVDGTGAAPLEDAVVLIEGDRIRYVARAAEASIPDRADVIDAHGRFVIPGLMDANVHLFAGITPDLLLEHESGYELLVEEAAQVALGSGVTTVFDTWGPLDPLVAVRDRINRGELVGSRMFVAGNIIGLGGPLSSDFINASRFFGPDTIDRVNRRWEQGVGQDLTWLPANRVRRRVREYIERSGIDLVKYAAGGHGVAEWRFITFAAQTQRAIVEEAHRAGLTVQAHTTSPESLRMEIDAGADLLQHGDLTGREPMSDEVLRDIVDRGLPVAAMLVTDRHLAWASRPGREIRWELRGEKDKNERRLIEAGARLMLTTDAFAWGPRVWNHPAMGFQPRDADDPPAQLGESHFRWLAAAVERGMAPMAALLAATRTIAQAYHKADELGTLEPGKRADLLILDADPLADARNYRRITQILKDGEPVDRDALPRHRVLTEPTEPTGTGPHGRG